MHNFLSGCGWPSAASRASGGSPRAPLSWKPRTKVEKSAMSGLRYNLARGKTDEVTRTVLAARSFAVYLSLPNVSTRQTLLPAVSDRVRPSGRTPATRRGRERLVHAPGQRRASHVGCGGGASGGAAAPRYSAPGEHAVEVRHHTRPRAAWAGMRVSEWGGACLCMVAGVTLQSRPRVLPGCPLVK